MINHVDDRRLRGKMKRKRKKEKKKKKEENRLLFVSGEDLSLPPRS
jgi:hypothetical protein